MIDLNIELAAEINTRLDELNSQLRAAVRSGIDTAKIRRHIETAETDREAALDRAAQAHAEDQRRVAEGIAEQGAQIAAAAAERVDAAIIPFITEESTMPTNFGAHATYIRQAAEQLATARAALARSVETHSLADAEVQGLQGRIDESEARRSAITARRLAGKSDQKDAAEFVALGADIEVLRGMLADAEHFADSLEPLDQSNAVSRAEEMLRRAEAEAVFQGLTARVQEIEAALIAGVRALRDAGAPLGHSHLSMSYRSSDELRRLIQLGVV